MTELVIDVPRLRKELEYVTTHREQWFQGMWIYRTSCGTTGCVAGNTALNAGYVPVFLSSRDNTTSTVRLHGHDERAVAGVAAEVLGLNRDQATLLFAATNTIYDLWVIASDLTDGEIEVPVEVVDGTTGHVEPQITGSLLIELNYQRGYALRQQLHERRRKSAVNELADLL